LYSSSINMESFGSSVPSTPVEALTITSAMVVGVDAGSSDKVAGPGRDRVRRSAVEVRSKEASPL
jgi:hypothetical protein